MKYEAPSMEIIRFQPTVNVLTASIFVTETPVLDNTRETMDDDDPFADED
ncbi:MAG: hypothetical protein IJD93_02200 [Ruminococcus sp.]|nr:hypothetical protein [Ruminococcus sp.]